jgi:hypothetical protein
MPLKLLNGPMLETNTLTGAGCFVEQLRLGRGSREQPDLIILCQVLLVSSGMRSEKGRRREVYERTPPLLEFGY